MRKGFTLIELLAVIVILAIIAIIAVPTISNVVSKAKKGVAEVSALNYIDAVEKYMILHDMNPTKYPYDIKGGTFNVASNTEVSLLDLIIPKASAESRVPSLNSFINVKGDKPKSGTITTDEKGKVTEANIEIKGYTVECTGSSCEAKGGNTPKATLKIEVPDSTEIKVSKPTVITVTTNSNDVITWESSDETVATVSDGIVTGLKPGNVTITASIDSITDSIDLTVKPGATKDLSQIYSSANVKQLGVLGVVYLNPTDGHLYDECNASNSTAGSGTTGCMKWYIYSETDDVYKLILDHNTANGVVWNSNNSTVAYSSSGAKASIDSLNWDNSLNSRIISTAEINLITGKTGFNKTNVEAWYYLDSLSQSQAVSSQGRSKYTWLYDYTSGCSGYGCDTLFSQTGAYGYITSDSNTGTHMWYIQREGYLRRDYANSATFGVRPVIEVDKSIIN